MLEIHTVLDRVAHSLSSRIERAITGLEDVRDQLLSKSAQIARQPVRGDFSFLASHFHDFLIDQQDFIEGAGIAYYPGSLADAVHWIEWWRMTPIGEPRFISHDLNPKSLRFYEYSTHDWFIKPQKLGRPMVIGPYVDMGGIDVNTVTITVPAQSSESTQTLGCDISLSALEERFIKGLQTLKFEVLLVGPNARVITSTVPKLVTGALIDLHAPSIHSIHPLSPHDSDRLPWQLVALNSK